MTSLVWKMLEGPCLGKPEDGSRGRGAMVSCFASVCGISPDMDLGLAVKKVKAAHTGNITCRACFNLPLSPVVHFCPLIPWVFGGSLVGLG